MGETIEPASAVGAEPNVTLQDLTSETSRNSTIDRAVSSALQDAVDRASSLPGASSERVDELHDLTSAAATEMSAAKDEILSDVAGEGANKEPSNEQDRVEEVAETLKSLIQEMTTWQITWGVAQTAQKDMTHVLKS